MKCWKNEDGFNIIDKEWKIFSANFKTLDRSQESAVLLSRSTDMDANSRVLPEIDIPCK